MTTISKSTYKAIKYSYKAKASSSKRHSRTKNSVIKMPQWTLPITMETLLDTKTTPSKKLKDLRFQRDHLISKLLSWPVAMIQQLFLRIVVLSHGGKLSNNKHMRKW